MSDFDRNHCPEKPGISVRLKPEQVSEYNGIRTHSAHMFLKLSKDWFNDCMQLFILSRDKRLGKDL